MQPGTRAFHRRRRKTMKPIHLALAALLAMAAPVFAQHEHEEHGRQRRRRLRSTDPNRITARPTRNRPGLRSNTAILSRASSAATTATTPVIPTLRTSIMAAAGLAMIPVATIPTTTSTIHGNTGASRAGSVRRTAGGWAAEIRAGSGSITGTGAWRPMTCRM